MFIVNSGLIKGWSWLQLRPLFTLCFSLSAIILGGLLLLPVLLASTVINREGLLSLTTWVAHLGSHLPSISWFNNNLHVKYRSNLIRTFWVKIKIKLNKCHFFRGHVGPLHKIQGYQGHKNVSKCRPHHSGDICTTRGNNLKTSFSFTTTGGYNKVTFLK